MECVSRYGEWIVLYRNSIVPNGIELEENIKFRFHHLLLLKDMQIKSSNPLTNNKCDCSIEQSLF